MRNPKRTLMRASYSGDGRRGNPLIASKNRQSIRRRPSGGMISFGSSTLLNLHRHYLAVAHRGAGLVCYSVTYLEYKSSCRVVYAIPLSHISDIRELARNFVESDRELYFKRPINIHGKLDAPSLIKYKVTPGGVI